MRFTLIGLAAIAIIGAIVVFVGPLFISTDDLRDSLFAQVEFNNGLSLAGQRTAARLVLSLARPGGRRRRHRTGRRGKFCRDSQSQVAAFRLAAVGTVRRQGQDDRSRANRSRHRGSGRAAAGKGGGRRECPASRNKIGKLRA